MQEYTKEDLMNLCQRAVVPYTEWQNRDSYIAQCNIEEAYNLLKADSPYEITSFDEDTVYVKFDLSDELRQQYRKEFQFLGIDSRDDYLDEFGHDQEMFDCGGIDWDLGYETAFIPTEKRLRKGGDWY